MLLSKVPYENSVLIEAAAGFELESKALRRQVFPRLVSLFWGYVKEGESMNQK
ncbi:hypothetical protein AVEN_218380-1, partial [Araneus ventricosus]